MVEERRLSPALLLSALVVYALLLAPMVVVIGASFTETTSIQFPPRGFTLRWYGAILDDQALTRGVALSAQVATAAATGAAILGSLGALFLARSSGFKREFFQSFFLGPLTIPHVLVGLAFLMVFSRAGLMNFTGLVIAHTVICTPYVVRSVLSLLLSADPQLPRAASVLGANPARTFFYVTLPTIRPGIVAGAVFAFLISFNNVSISMFVSSATASTLPVVIFNKVEYVPDPTIIAVSALMILTTSVLLLALDRAFSLFGAMFR